VRVVVDAGPLIHLSWIHQLDLLDHLFEEVFLPPAVRVEVLAPPRGTLGLERVQRALGRAWLQLQAPSTQVPTNTVGSLDPGETEALLLAAEVGADLVLTDDAAARTAARRLGLEAIGTVGVLVIARERGLIPEALPLLLELRRLGQWLSEELVQAVQQRESGTSI